MLIKDLRLIWRRHRRHRDARNYFLKNAIVSDKVLVAANPPSLPPHSSIPAGASFRGKDLAAFTRVDEICVNIKHISTYVQQRLNCG